MKFFRNLRLRGNRAFEPKIVLRAGSEPGSYPSSMIGYLAERSTRHAAGWVVDQAAPANRVAFDIVVATPDGAKRVVASATADLYSRTLAMLGIGDACHSFRILFDKALTEIERDSLEIRPVGCDTFLPHDPKLRARWEPVTHVAMDIVDNCNLRCPFCLYDYNGVNKTNLMADEMFDSTLRLLPFVGPGHFWLSCFHEPTLHPRLVSMLERIPDDYRDNVFFTTNLAKRMPPAYYEALARSSLHHINISIESRDRAIYERMRKGARHRIFQENWAALLDAFRAEGAPPLLRYIIMAYKSNLREIPDLVRHLRDECCAWNVEVRDTYDVQHMPSGFREAEFLDLDEWRWLHRMLSVYNVQDVMLSLPAGFTPASAAGVEPVAALVPEAALTPYMEPASIAARDDLATARLRRVPGLCEIKLSWNGDMSVSPALAGDYPSERLDVIHTNILDIDDLEHFFLTL